MATMAGWRFWIDTGGTFTDCLAETPQGEPRRLKVLSSGAVRGDVTAIGADGVLAVRGFPAMPDGGFAGYRLRRLRDGFETAVLLSCHQDMETRLTIMEGARGSWETGDVVDGFGDEEAPVLAMRVVTGTALSEKLPPAELRLATTRGTNALLEARGAAVAFFVTAGFADLLRIGDQRRPDLFALRVEKPPPLHGPVVEVQERLAADGSVVQALEVASLREAATAVRRQGVDVAAVALLHSYRNPVHERAVAVVLRELGFSHVSLSAELAPFIRIVPRAETTVVDAVLAPVMDGYLDGVAREVDAARFFVMTSAGGLVRRAAYRPKDSLLSGPAGGVAGAAGVARAAGLDRVLSFDMGGTSTDVARWAGDFDYRFQHTVGHARVFAPALRVESVAAGGGSICRFDGAAFVVGPESAGAAPGPACYGAGGPLTLTDVNLLLGRLDPSTFAVPVSVPAAEERLVEVLEQVRQHCGKAAARDEALEGFLAIADERMAEAIRRISVREGYDPGEHVLVAFGGAGGLHACAVAERLGVRTILFPADSGLLSAAGLREAVPERFAERQILMELDVARPQLASWFDELEDRARSELGEDGVDPVRARIRRAELELRFVGQESGLVIEARPFTGIETRFRVAHEARFGYVPAARSVEVVVARVVVSGVPNIPGREEFIADAVVLPSRATVKRDQLRAGNRFAGPRLIADQFSTLFVARGWQAGVGTAGTIRLSRVGESLDRRAAGSELIELELFTCRFSALVEEMGGMLQRCALSVNVKERLDFSCALLDAKGELVANAPHIPVHLGALGLCVRTLCERIVLGPGDVVVTNHPAFGGSHLPDVTVVAPVHDPDNRLLGYVANRAHHAEIGGLRPGSMSPEACCLAQEGVVIAPRYLVRQGETDWPGMRRTLESGPFPSRLVDENLADLHAQLAAVRRGAENLRALAVRHGAMCIERYMAGLRLRAADALATALERLPGGPWWAEDSLDDGSILRVHVTSGPPGPRLRVDFTGSSPVHPGNLNATPAIVRSALLYVLRLLAGRSLPLNEGLLRDVELIVPLGILSPDFPSDPEACPAVAGGNVETSQRIVDVLLSALGLTACSQGTMNNVTLGIAGLSYYETIGGGTGAGPGFDGCDAVHSHMTNTAMTDLEVMEVRLPVRVMRFAVRAGSGGCGRQRGGEGIERRLRFLAPAFVSILAQRQGSGPPGMDGGSAGAPGRAGIARASGVHEELAGCAQADLLVGDELVILTPGGGGFGGRA